MLVKFGVRVDYFWEYLKNNKMATFSTQWNKTMIIMFLFILLTDVIDNTRIN